ncbi:peroxidase family protein [Neoroseomonas rubea]|uniref:peroxidase family protein n=1 Tax=Neoroseomonas rubea TaxID=2748666 RepID=UPI0018DF9D4E|nr:peroxidase family protein [Roseomonas rubea]
MVTLVKHDLEFILRQIKIAEAHAAGTALTDIRVDAAGNVVGATDPGALAISNTLLPYGLRTVDGSYNNLNPGRELWGASNQPFINVLTTQYRNDLDGDSITFGAGTPGAVTLNNGNYDPNSNPSPRDTVVDADPRIISNLVIDQTIENPAAVSAGLAHAGLTGQALTDALAAVMAAPMVDPDGTGEIKDRKTVLESYGVVVNTTVNSGQNAHTVYLPNVAPDEGLSAPYNSWFTLFGQFFDHGLDLVKKNSESGTVYIPLQKDDPLYVEGAATNFMAMTRIDQTEPNNLTTPFVDQNQTYTSHASHQFFLREYVSVDGKPVATGKLLEGAKGGLATWGDIKAQAREVLGINLTDDFVGSVPLVKTDQYGNFVPGANGMPQVVILVETPAGSRNFVEELRSGAPGAPLDISGAARIANAFLDDIAHDAVPVIIGGALAADADDIAGNRITLKDQRGQNLEYDNELLDAHFITGDGRGNENIGLTAVHHVFHSEHNHLVEQVKLRALESGDIAFLNDWLLSDLPADTVLPAATDTAALEALAGTLNWDGERLFQAARFTNEMQYQHLVFEEFARKVQPDVDAFVFNASMDIDPAIFAEFAHVVYRFGHSMLNETVDLVSATGQKTSMDLFTAFLNPIAFDSNGTVSHEEAAAAVVRGMTAQVGNEIDEFVTDVLRNQLVGIPLDLAVLNIARGRDAGIPAFNEARRQFQEIAQGDTQLNAYTSWSDFAVNMRNPASIVNFIAAYGTHETITGETTVDGKRAAAMKLVFGGDGAPADRLDFLNARGAYAGGSLGGLEDVDLWVGGLAEKKMPFGGMLGSTFSFIFELQLENLQNGDRFYYLSRVQGLNLLNELENNSLAKMVMNNTTLGDQDYALPGDIFSTPDHTFYVDPAKQAVFGTPEPLVDDPTLAAMGVGGVERDTNFIRYNGADHIVVGGTDGNDTIISGGGDDALWGFDGNDRLEAGDGVDKVHGGKGDDIITNNATPIGEVDMLHGEEGNDVIHGGHGLALIFGNQGQDAIITGPDGKEAFGGTESDFILGGEGGDFLLGNEGDDWIEGGNGFDVIAGDNSELFFNSSIIGHDVMFAGQNENDFDAESGDDIMVQGESVMRSEGMWGYDWASHKGFSRGADADLTVPIFTTDQAETLRNRFDQVEALSGSNFADVLRGDSRSSQNAPEVPGAVESQMLNNELTQAGVNRIDGLRELMGNFVAAAPTTGDLEKVIAFDRGNILLGGGGADTIEGRGGDDVIDGDAWLDVQIKVDLPGTENDLFVDSLTQIQAALLSGAINPGQLSIVRSIQYALPFTLDPTRAIDTAVYTGNRADYDFSINADGSWTVAHTRGTQTDGTDRLLHIERLQFADGAWAPPNATLTLSDLTPTATRMLTATLVEPDGFQGGVAPTIVWEIRNGNGPWTQVATGETFTPPANIGGVGNFLRVSATYVDALGVQETVSVTSTKAIGGVFNDTAASNTIILGDADNIVLGNGGNDTVMGNGGNDSMDGGDGNDQLWGGVGDDLLIGGAGNDSLGGWAGVDTMEGGTGNDTYYVGNAASILTEVAANGGTDLVVTNLSAFTLGAHFENLTYSNGNGSFAGTGNELGNRITAGSSSSATLSGLGGNDTLEGGNGNDSLLGGEGNDSLTGGTLGNDTLDGGVGADVMSGGQGNDTYFVDNAGDVVTGEILNLGIFGSFNLGTDTVITTLTTYTLGTFIENLTYSGTANFTGSGNGLANVMIGAAGQDSLSGGAGNDLLDGGAANDRLTGGTGADLFRFGANFGDDVITDFVAAGTGQDRIDVRGLGLTVADFGTAITVADSGAGAVISMAGGTVTLTGITAANITTTDFIFS